MAQQFTVARRRFLQVTGGSVIAAGLFGAAGLCGGAEKEKKGEKASQPPMLWGDTSHLGRPYAKDPAVIRWQDRYLLYCSLPPYEDKRPHNGWRIGIAESHDLRTWRKIAELQPEGPAEAKGLCAAGALAFDGHVHLFYQTYGNGPKDALCHAVSTDGVKFVRHPENPIFRPTGAWNVGRAIDADAIVHDGQVLLYFATRDPAMKTQMLGAARAACDSGFGRSAWKQWGDGPILKPELPWEQECIEAPSVCYRDGRFFMFYAGAYNNRPQQIGVAVSRDGRAWQRLSNEPFLRNGAPGAWNASESGHPGYFEDADGQCYLFYQGNNDRGRTWQLSWVKLRWRNGRPEAIV